MVSSKVLKTLLLLLYGYFALFPEIDARGVELRGSRVRRDASANIPPKGYQATRTYRWRREDENDDRPVEPPTPEHYKEIRRAFDFWSQVMNCNFTETAQTDNDPSIVIDYGNWSCSYFEKYPDVLSMQISMHVDKEALAGKDANYIYKLIIHEIGHHLRLIHSNDTDSLMHADLDGIADRELTKADFHRLQKLQGHRHPRRDNIDICSTTHIDAIVPFENNRTLLVFADRQWYSLNGTKQRFGLRSSFPELHEWVDYVDAVLAVDNKLWIFAPSYIHQVANYSLGQSGGNISLLSFVKIGLPSRAGYDSRGPPSEHITRVQAAFSLPSKNGSSTEHYILAGGYSWKLKGVRKCDCSPREPTEEKRIDTFGYTAQHLKVDPSSKTPIGEKWINMPGHVNAAFSYNGELYFIGSETKYTPTGKLNEYGNPTYSMVEVMTLYTTTEHNGVYTLTESEENPNEFLFKLTGTDFVQNCNQK